MIIAGFQKNSTIDFPGRLCCVVFTAGCNYDCYYCHNRHLIGAQEKVFKEEIFDFLKKRQGLIEGVVITGGEPSLHRDLPSFIKDVKDLGYAVKLDTNGSNPKILEELIENHLLDYVAIDYKVPFMKYDLIGACEDAGANQESVTSAIDITMRSGIDYEIRTTVIPEITDDDLMAMAKSFPPFMSFVLQKYRPVAGDPGESPKRIYHKKEDLERLTELLRPYQPAIFIRA